MLTGCKSDKLPVEEGVLVHILVDTHFAEAALLHVNPAMKDSVAKVYYSQIYERHQINEADFDTSLAILKRKPLMNWMIHQRVLTIIDSIGAGVLVD
jgi:hypothetical protein